MPLQVSARIDKDTIGDLEEVRESFFGHLYRYVDRDVVQEAAGIAKEKARSADGTLRRSMAGKTTKLRDGVRGVIGSNLPYAAFQEFGTGPRGHRSWQRYASRFHWPRIKYSLPVIKPKRASVMRWRSKYAGKGPARKRLRPGQRQMVFAATTKGQPGRPALTYGLWEIDRRDLLVKAIEAALARAWNTR